MTAPSPGPAVPPDFETAMVLAAGLGVRLRPLTETVPKPLLEVDGRPLIDHVLDRLRAGGVRKVVVNAFYLADQLEAHLADRQDLAIEVVREPKLLGIGGGLANALPILGHDRFLAANADTLWLDGPVPVFKRLAQTWNEAAMDALLLMQPAAKAVGEEGMGDFFLDPAGRVVSRGHGQVAPYYYAGLQVLHPRLFRDPPPVPFNMTRLWDRALEAGRLWGMVHDGPWFHVNTPEALATAREMMLEQNLRWMVV